MHREKQCVRVNKLFDWISHCIEIKQKETITFKKEDCLKNNLCLPFRVPCDGSTSTLWNGNHNKEFIGSFAITIDKQCKGTITLLVNGEELTSLTGGQSFSAVLSDLQLIEIKCEKPKNHSLNCSGTLEIQLTTLHEKKKRGQKVHCYLSDANGKPLDPNKRGAIHCEEQSHPLHRKCYDVTGKDGTKSSIQEIEMLIKGFVTIEIMDELGIETGWCTFPFWEVETFYLCAPKGTHIGCKISQFNCSAHLISSYPKHAECLDVSIRIRMTLNISSIKKVKVEIEGVRCKPRSEPIDYCLQKHRNLALAKDEPARSY